MDLLFRSQATHVADGERSYCRRAPDKLLVSAPFLGGGMDRHSSRNQQEVFGEQGPEWQEVPSVNLADPPYASIAKIKSTHVAGYPSAEGTGWYWRNGIVVTAAHVVWGALSVECKFSNGALAKYCGNEDAHLKYHTGPGKNDGSVFDIAVLRIQSGPEPAGLEIVENSFPPEVTAIGSRIGFDALYEHKGATLDWGAYIGHFAHTTNGHSGCPLIADGKVAAMHLGEGLIATINQPGVALEIPAYSNAGLVLSNVQMEFLNQRFSSSVI